MKGHPNDGKRKSHGLRGKTRTKSVATDCLVTRADGTQYTIPARKPVTRNTAAATYRASVKRAAQYEREIDSMIRKQQIGEYGEGRKI